MAQVFRQATIDRGSKQRIRDASKRIRRWGMRRFRHRLGSSLGERRQFGSLRLHGLGGRTRVAELVAPGLLHEVDEFTYLLGDQPCELIDCP